MINRNHQLLIFAIIEHHSLNKLQCDVNKSKFEFIIFFFEEPNIPTYTILAVQEL